MPTLTARIEAEALEPTQVQVAWVKGDEELSRLYAFHIRVIGAAGVTLDEERLLGEAARLVIESDGAMLRLIHGIIHRIESDVHAESGLLAWDLVLVPRAFALTLGEATEIAMDSSIPEIVTERLGRFGLASGKDFDLSLQGAYAPREFVVQFKESHADFVARLTEHLGISFFFRQAEDRETLVFADANTAMTTENDGLKIPYRARGERMDVFALRGISNIVSSKVSVRDYNYRTPGVGLDASQSTESKWGEHFEYGGHFKTPAEATAIARARREELACQKKIFHGKSARPELSPGTRITIEGHPSGDKQLLVTSVQHSLEQSAFGSDVGEHGAYENTFTAIDVATPFRPRRRTPRPFVPGVLTAVVETPEAGEYAEVDEEGRYRVRFAFDRSSAKHAKASRPIRMAQPHAGAGYGFHFPLRDGVEVLITCVEGDPDRPIISGAIPNPTTPSTVAENNTTRNVIRTGGGTEINIDDTAGSERMKISVPFANTVLQLGAPNNPTPGIFFGTDKDVRLHSGEDCITQVDKDQSCHVKGNRNDNVVGDCFKHCANWTISVDGLFSVSSAQQLFSAGEHEDNTKGAYTSHAGYYEFAAAESYALNAPEIALYGEGEGGSSLFMDAGTIELAVGSSCITMEAGETTITVGGSCISLIDGKITLTVGGSTITLTGSTVTAIAGLIELNP